METVASTPHVVAFSVPHDPNRPLPLLLPLCAPILPLILCGWMDECRSGLDAMYDEIDEIIRRNAQEFRKEVDSLFDQSKDELAEVCMHPSPFPLRHTARRWNALFPGSSPVARRMSSCSLTLIKPSFRRFPLTFDSARAVFSFSLSCLLSFLVCDPAALLPVAG